MTHSLEVTQLAHSIARALHLNEDMCEAISLAHDLGPTPFGHAGQDPLDESRDTHWTNGAGHPMGGGGRVAR